MAGLDGIKNKIHPGEAMDKDLYDLPAEELAGLPTVCAGLDEALAALDADRAFPKGVFSRMIRSTLTSILRWKRSRPCACRPTPWNSSSTTPAKRLFSGSKGAPQGAPFYASFRGQAPNMRGLAPTLLLLPGLVANPTGADAPIYRLDYPNQAPEFTDRPATQPNPSVTLGTPSPSPPCRFQAPITSRPPTTPLRLRTLRADLSEIRHRDSLPEPRGGHSSQQRCSSLSLSLNPGLALRGATAPATGWADAHDHRNPSGSPDTPCPGRAHPLIKRLMQGAAPSQKPSEPFPCFAPP